jgi:hypothetical protein
MRSSLTIAEYLGDRVMIIMQIAISTNFCRRSVERFMHNDSLLK